MIHEDQCYVQVSCVVWWGDIGIVTTWGSITYYYLGPTWLQTSHGHFATKSHAKGSNCVKWSWYTTLKINNKHQIKVSAHFVFFPVCEYIVLVYPTDWFFHSKIKAWKNKINPKSEMSASECQILGCLQGNWLCKISSLNLQRWSSVSLLRGAHSKWLSHICSSNLKGWSSNAIAKSRAFVYFRPSIHLATLKIQCLSNFEQTTSPEVVNNSGNEATSLARIPFLFA